MKRVARASWIILLVVLSAFSALPATGASHSDQNESLQKKPPPNILFVLIDDLGWGDIGFHVDPKTTTGGASSSIDAAVQQRRKREVQTPNMDRLATEEGLELNRHYVHCTCTGTRTSLQSGRFPVHVQTSLKNPDDPSSGMPRNLTGIAEHLKHGANYATHYVGKWDVGMASPKHTPKGRGYDTSLNYFNHKNDYWTQECLQSVCCRRFHMEQTKDGTSAEKFDQNKPIVYDLWDTDRPARELVESDYEELIFQQRLLEIIDDHALKQQDQELDEQQPLFLFYAPHVAHCPLQVPQSYLDQFDFIDDDEGICRNETPYILEPNRTSPPYSCRKQYRAMVKLLDDIVGSVVDRFKHHGLWSDTIMVVTSDNGGPVHPRESGATNFPLRGGKYSDWEGGVRATAFVSGGYIPKHRRGKVVREPIHICDWYATLPALAGINVHEEERKVSNKVDTQVPPVDGVNIWSLISGDQGEGKDETTPRVEIPLSAHALIDGEFKLIWNDNHDIIQAGWTGPDYPNSKTKLDGIDSYTLDCKTGCLFNVEKDPGEHVNIAESEPVRVQAMKKRLQELRKGFFENNDQGVDSCPKEYRDSKDNLPCACWMAVNYYGGFMGPFQEVNITKGWKSGDSKETSEERE